MNLNSAKGSAILTALFIMILVAIAATAMSLRTQIDIDRSQLIEHANQLNRAAEKGKYLAFKQLLNNAKKFNKKKTQWIDYGLFQPQTTHIDGAEVMIEIVDLQGRFNLNSVLRNDKVNAFAELLKNQMGLKNSTARSLALNTQAWLAPAKQSALSQQLDTYYLKQKIPYQASHHPFVNSSELRLVKGFTQKRFNHLLPLVTALPVNVPTNIMTAPLPVLRTLGVGLTTSQAKILKQAQQKGAYWTLEELLKSPKIQSFGLRKNQLTFTSQFFLIKVNARLNSLQFAYYTIVRRTIRGKKARLHVLSETLNTP